jgi:hypothetical protein
MLKHNHKKWLRFSEVTASSVSAEDVRFTDKAQRGLGWENTMRSTSLLFTVDYHGQLSDVCEL